MYLNSVKTVAVDSVRFMVCAKEHPRCVLIFTPALGVPADYYLPLAETLNQQGIMVILNELRGNGMSTIIPGRHVDFGYRELVNQDLRIVVAWVQENVPEMPLFLGGHSLGGHLAFLYTAKYAGAIQGLILIASSVPYFKTYPLALALQIYLGSYVFQIIAWGMGFLPGKWFGFGRREARTLINEWSFTARTNRFKINGDPFEYNQALSKITCPILSICFKGDKFAPYQAVKSTAAKFNSDQLDLLYLDGVDYMAVNHFSWVERSENIHPIITNWVNGI